MRVLRFELAIRFGGEEFFWLRCRPIRFNHEARKIYAIRHRRYRNSAVAGDICWEIPWDERLIFCVHKGRLSLRRVSTSIFVATNWVQKGTLLGLLQLAVRGRVSTACETCWRNGITGAPT